MREQFCRDALATETASSLHAGRRRAAAIQGLHAQATPPTYAVVDISSVTDPEGFKALGPKAPLANAAFCGKFIMRTDNITASDGTAPKRFVVIAFDSLEKAKAWTASAAQKEVDAIRAKTCWNLSRSVRRRSVDAPPSAGRLFDIAQVEP